MNQLSAEQKEARRKFFMRMLMLQKEARLELIEKRVDPELADPSLGKMTVSERDLLLRNQILATRWSTEDGRYLLAQLNQKIKP